MIAMLLAAIILSDWLGKLKTFACRAPSSWRLRLTVQRLVRLRCCNFLKESLAASKVDRITVWQGARLGGRLAGPPVGHLPCQSITIQPKEKKHQNIGILRHQLIRP